MAQPRESAYFFVHRNSPSAARMIVSGAGKTHVTELGYAAEYCIKLWATKEKPSSPHIEISDPEGAYIEIVGADVSCCVTLRGDLVFSNPVDRLEIGNGTARLRTAGQISMSDGELFCASCDTLYKDGGQRRVVAGGLCAPRLERRRPRVGAVLFGCYTERDRAPPARSSHWRAAHLRCDPAPSRFRRQAVLARGNGPSHASD